MHQAGASHARETMNPLWNGVPSAYIAAARRGLESRRGWCGCV